MTTREPTPPPKKRGPDPETLQIDGDWEDAVKEALKRPPPPRETNEKGRGE